jgi:hypothetical protein
MLALSGAVGLLAAGCSADHVPGDSSEDLGSERQNLISSLTVRLTRIYIGNNAGTGFYTGGVSFSAFPGSTLPIWECPSRSQPPILPQYGDWVPPPVGQAITFYCDPPGSLGTACIGDLSQATNRTVFTLTTIPPGGGAIPVTVSFRDTTGNNSHDFDWRFDVDANTGAVTAAPIQGNAVAVTPGPNGEQSCARGPDDWMICWQTDTCIPSVPCLARPASHPTCPSLAGATSCFGGVAICSALDSDSDGSPDGADTDGDGLLDRWETNGIDWECDGTLEADFAPMRNAVGAAAGLADPNHKDLFLEIDVEQVAGGPNIALPATEIQRIKDAFALSPVTNPDGTTGIRLWIDTPNGDALGGGTFIPGIGISRLSGRDQEYFGGALPLDRCCYPNTLPDCATDPGADSTPGNLPPVAKYLDCRHHDTRARFFADPCCLPAAQRPAVCASPVGTGTGGYDCTAQPRGVENSQFRFLYFRYALEALDGFENPQASEDGLGACNNGLDDSADGFADWNGVGALPPAPECANDPFGAELNGGLGSCSDGRDGDGVADRSDPDCAIDPFLRELDGLGGFAEEGSCSNRVDDNQAPGAERLTDVQDPDCMGLPVGEIPGRPWTCFDGRDNNGDLLIDGADPGCAGLPQEDGAGPGTCTNGIDDSSIGLPMTPTSIADFADGAGDWDDPDCAGLPREDLAGPNSCWDGRDNGDGPNNLDRTLDCYLFPTGEDGVGGPETCVDGIDNQADRVADRLDADCWDFTVVPAVYQPNRAEDGEAGKCGDGKDNSADGADVNDVDDCPALPTENDAGAGSCFDGMDNHLDGLTDSADPDCMGGTVLNSEDGFANPPGQPPSCGDGIDNGNGAFDGADPDCAGQGFAYPVEGAMGTASSCTNGIDDDGNLVKDWDDCACNPRKPGCAPAPGAPRLPAEDGLGANSCFDFADNSADGFDGSSQHGECTYWGGWGGHPRGFIDNDHNAFVVMHEFGHTLGLDHGGPTKTNGMATPGLTTNCKPPYLSIMNYSYVEIPQAYDPTRAEGPGVLAGTCGDPLGADEDGDSVPNELDPDCLRGPSLLDFAPPRYPDPTQPTGFGRGQDLSQLGLDEAAPREDLIWDAADTSNAFIFVYPDRFLPGRSESGGVPDGSCGDLLNADEDNDRVANASDPQCYGGVEWRMPVNGYNYLLSENPMNPVQGGNCGNNMDDDGDMTSDAADPDCYGYDFDASGSITQGAPIAAVNLNNGPNSLCYNGALESLSGPNDWENLAYATYGSGRPAPVELVPDPPVDPDASRKNQLLTDVALELVPAPEVIVMNERADFVATLSNNGPALVASARLKLTLTEGLGFGALPSGCQVSGGTALCLFGRLLPGSQIVVDFTIAPTSNPSGAPRFLRAEAIGQGNEEVAPANNAVDVRIIAESDLELVDVVPEAASVTVLMGDTVAFDVDTDVVSHGPSNPVDSELSFVVTAPPGVTVTPDVSPVLVPDLDLDLRTVASSFTIECQKMGVYQIGLQSTVLSAGLVYDDPDLTNNSDSTSFVVRCIPCVHATSSFVQADATTVTSAQVHGGTYFELGANSSRVNGDVFVAGNAFLRSTAIVDGDLTLSGQIQTQGPYQITGTASPLTPVSVLPIESHPVTTGTQDRTVAVNGNANWAPGSYDDGFVGSFGTANLSAGTYNFRTFEVNVDGLLNLDTSGGDIVINARTVLRFGDRSKLQPSGAGRVSFYTNATSTNLVRIGTDVKFKASLTAPTGTVHAYSRTQIDGCIAGRTIRLEPNITLSQP